MIYYYVFGSRLGDRYMDRLVIAKVRNTTEDLMYRKVYHELRDIINDTKGFCYTTRVKALKFTGEYGYRALTLHPDYDTITQQLAERVPDVRDLIVRQGYPALPLQDGTLPISHAGLLIARKAFKYSAGTLPVFVGEENGYNKFAYRLSLVRRGVNTVPFGISGDA